MEKKKHYMVKDLSQLSGVSVRTLHHYDSIGLLKPAYYGSNGYRYYEKEQLMLLQQILFYRELKFDLAAIHKIIYAKDFDPVEALKNHRTRLVQETLRNQELIETIDRTLEHLTSEHEMEEQEVYKGFGAKKDSGQS